MRSIRLRRAAGAIGALALATCGAALASAGDPVAKLAARVAPKALPSKKPAAVKLTLSLDVFYEDSAGGEDGSLVPPRANRIVALLPDNLVLDPTRVSRCNVELGDLTTDAAVEACGKAKVSKGQGRAILSLPLGPDGARVDSEAVVTVFNGPRRAGRPTILFHSYVPELDQTTVLTGIVGAAGGKYGTRLDVSAPPLPGGEGALRELNVSIKRGRYIQGTCPGDDRKLNFKTVFSTEVGTLRATSTRTCSTRA